MHWFNIVISDFIILFSSSFSFNLQSSVFHTFDNLVSHGFSEFGAIYLQAFFYLAVWQPRRSCSICSCYCYWFCRCFWWWCVWWFWIMFHSYYRQKPLLLLTDYQGYYYFSLFINSRNSSTAFSSKSLPTCSGLNIDL